jgi:hypothetical protein
VAVAQFISTVSQAGSGLGQHKDTLSEQQISSILKVSRDNGPLGIHVLTLSLVQGQYATDLLYIASLGLAKLSTAATVVNLAARTHRNLVHGTGVVVLAWAVTGFIVVLFQCQLPAPWDFINKSCIARVRRLLGSLPLHARSS